VAQPTKQEAREVFEARALIEPKVAALAADVAKPAEIAQLRLHLEKEHEALHAGRDSDAIMLSAKFHVGIAEIAGHSILTGFVKD
ncbi:MAG: GntR family transcriptional regulator, partial [Mesorhizobium sp.]